MQGAWLSEETEYPGLVSRPCKTESRSSHLSELIPCHQGMQRARMREAACDKAFQKHARKNLEPRIFEELTRGFKSRKYSDCKKKVGKERRDGYCEVRKSQQLPSAAAMGSMDKGKQANATVCNDSDHDSTVATASKSICAPMDTSNGDQHPNVNEPKEEEEEEEEEMGGGAHGDEEREYCRFMRGKYVQLKGEYEKLKREYAQIQSENERLRLLH